MAALLPAVLRVMVDQDIALQLQLKNLRLLKEKLNYVEKRKMTVKNLNEDLMTFIKGKIKNSRKKDILINLTVEQSFLFQMSLITTNEMSFSPFSISITNFRQYDW